jgi:hypothetical protein
MNTPAPLAPGLHMTALDTDPEAVDRLIARVLRRAHRSSETLNAPDEARAILHVAQSFADELTVANPRFDRLRFINDVTEHPS